MSNELIRNPEHYLDPTAANAIANVEYNEGEVWLGENSERYLIVKKHDNTFFSALKLVYTRDIIRLVINGVEMFTDPRHLSYVFGSRMKCYDTSVTPDELRTAQTEVGKLFGFGVGADEHAALLLKNENRRLMTDVEELKEDIEVIRSKWEEERRKSATMVGKVDALMEVVKMLGGVRA